MSNLQKTPRFSTNAANKMLTGMLLLLTFCVAGCTSINPLDRTALIQAPPRRVEVLRGKPRRAVDALGRFFGIPNRLAILDERIDNHQISLETETALTSYLSANGLSDVLVRVNQYDPVGEWKRLVKNKRIRPFWKYTVGSYDTLKYTLLPGRVFGGDWYNPFTDTINLYSDVPALAVSKGAYAVDVRQRLNPGAYAMLKEVPFLGLQHDTFATRTTLEYFETQRPGQLQAAKDVLVPNYGADWGGQIASVLPYGATIGRIIGGTIGNIANGNKFSGRGIRSANFGQTIRR